MLQDASAVSASIIQAMLADVFAAARCIHCCAQVCVFVFVCVCVCVCVCVQYIKLVPDMRR